MKFSNSTLFTVILLVAATIQAARLDFACRLIEIRLGFAEDTAAQTAKGQLRNATKLSIYDHAATAESLDTLLEVCQMRHRELISNAGNAEPSP